MKSASIKPYLSLVIPVFNEEQRLEKGLSTILNYLQLQKYAWEIVLVDDGSVDKTVSIAERIFQGKKNCLISHHKSNLGKGAGVRTGVNLARGRFVVFTDIDLSVPISGLSQMLLELNKFRVVIGVRRHPQSNVIKHQSVVREFLGQCFTKLTQSLVGDDICDATCGFKGFQKEAARKIFTQAKISRWAFDAEILFLAKKFNYSICQMPVVWRNDTGTKVNMFHDGLQAIGDLVRIKIYDWIGRY